MIPYLSEIFSKAKDWVQSTLNPDSSSYSPIVGGAKHHDLTTNDEHKLIKGKEPDLSFDLQHNAGSDDSEDDNDGASEGDGEHVKYPPLPIEVGNLESTLDLYQDAECWLIGSQDYVQAIMLVNFKLPQDAALHSNWRKWSSAIEF